MVQILVTHSDALLRNFYSLDAVEKLRGLGQVRINETGGPLRGADLVRAAEGCEIIVSDRLAPGDPEVFAALPDLVAFLRCAVDIRNVNVEAASRHGILVVRCSAGYAEAVGELAFGFMIDLQRRITESATTYRAGQDRHPMILGQQLAGGSIGIIGYGSIGRHIAHLAIAFGMEVLVFDPYVRVVNGCIDQVDFDTVLARPDFVVCAAYATPETQNMMNATAFAKMRQSAFFINISRGALVDEDALERALTSGQIAGAGLDVGRGYDEQPSLRLARLPNVIATPHVAGLTPDASEHQAEETVKQVRDILAGRAPKLAVNAAAATRLSRLRAVA